METVKKFSQQKKCIDSFNFEHVWSLAIFPKNVKLRSRPLKTLLVVIKHNTHYPKSQIILIRKRRTCYEIVSKTLFSCSAQTAHVPSKDLVAYYCACIRSALDYACPVLYNALPKYLRVELESPEESSLVHFPENIIRKCPSACRNRQPTRSSRKTDFATLSVDS